MESTILTQAGRGPLLDIHPVCRVCSGALLWLLCGLGVTPVALAEGLSATTTVERFQAALKRGDQARALSLMSRRAIVFEEGEKDTSRRDYARNHLPQDMRTERHRERTLLSRKTGGSGEVRWVLSEYRLEGDVDAKEEDAEVVETETMILKQVRDNWRIVHIHWSTQP